MESGGGGGPSQEIDSLVQRFSMGGTLTVSTSLLIGVPLRISTAENHRYRNCTVSMGSTATLHRANISDAQRQDNDFKLTFM